MTVAITIHQPYASLIAHGVKQWETRPHPPAGWPGIPEGVRRMPGVRVESGETPPWHPYCGCTGCRSGDWHGRRIVLRLSNNSKPKIAEVLSDGR